MFRYLVSLQIVSCQKIFRCTRKRLTLTRSIWISYVKSSNQTHSINSFFRKKEQKFPSSFPFDPPFIRVVKPRFAFHSGHVTVGLKFSEFLFFTKFFFGWLFSLFVKGGSICFELLTRSGWSPACTIESVLIQIRTEMVGKRFFFFEIGLESILPVLNITNQWPILHIFIWKAGGGALDFTNFTEYTEEEAKQAFERVARQHKWMWAN